MINYSTLQSHHAQMLVALYNDMLDSKNETAAAQTNDESIQAWKSSWGGLGKCGIQEVPISTRVCTFSI